MVCSKIRKCSAGGLKKRPKSSTFDYRTVVFVFFFYTVNVIFFNFRLLHHPSSASTQQRTTAKFFSSGISRGRYTCVVIEKKKGLIITGPASLEPVRTILLASPLHFLSGSYGTTHYCKIVHLPSLHNRPFIRGVALCTTAQNTRY